MKEIKIGDKTYNVRIAKTEAEKVRGLSDVKELPEDEGMLFVYEDLENELTYTMEDTSIDLDIIFIDDYGEVISVNPSKAFQKEPIVCEEPAQFVLEVNINSGIKPGDYLDDYNDEDEDVDFSDEERETMSKSKMLVLDENGDVQMKLFGGERIVSRIKTRQIVKQALIAYLSDDDEEYIKLGKMLFKELDAQDSRTPEYVEAPSKD